MAGAPFLPSLGQPKLSPDTACVPGAGAQRTKSLWWEPLIWKGPEVHCGGTLFLRRFFYFPGISQLHLLSTIVDEVAFFCFKQICFFWLCSFKFSNTRAILDCRPLKDKKCPFLFLEILHRSKNDIWTDGRV